jgi:hypothetical protein
MTFQSTSFDMGSVLNKLRSIQEAGPDAVDMGGQEIDNASFTRTMARLAAIKDAVGEDHYNAMRAGVRSLYMNRRPNLQQMTALIELLETILSYVAEDNALFQRLKTDLARDKANDTSPADQATASAPEIGAPATAQPDMRQLKV